MKIVPILGLSALLTAALPAHAADRIETVPTWGPYFLGHESEPAMDYGGRVIISLHRAICDLGHKFTGRIPPVAPAYEFPFAIAISTLQHEIHGHGARAREYNLNPSYGFGLDFSAYTTVDKDPRSNEQMATLSGGGTEADLVMARRLLIDLCQPGGAPASSVPLMFLGKVDLSIYVLSTVKPRADRRVPPDGRGSGRTGDDDDEDSSFTDQFEDGNDIAIYLVTRQAQRLGGTPADVWNRDYLIDFSEADLNDTYDHVQDMAIWNLVDPMMWSAMFLYVTDHAIRGKTVIPAPALPLGQGFALTVGTRGALGPQSVSRFLDLYLVTPVGVVSVYGRDLRSTDDSAFGVGAGLHRLALGPHVRASAQADLWANPDAPEDFYDGSGWNASGEIEFPVSPAVGVALKIGAKSDGFFPGTPTDSGAYAGAGVTAAF